jgi:hypothetical protein
MPGGTKCKTKNLRITGLLAKIPTLDLTSIKWGHLILQCNSKMFGIRMHKLLIMEHFGHKTATESYNKTLENCRYKKQTKVNKVYTN